MKRQATFLFILPLIFLLAGCSMFGVATKGDLDKLAQQDIQARQVLQNRIDDVNRSMSDVTRQLDALEPKLANIESEVQQLNQSMAMSQQRFMDLELDLRSNLDRVRTDMQVVYDDMQMVQDGMVLVSSQASTASKHSKRVVTAQHGALIEERERLMDYMAQLEERIQAWQTHIQDMGTQAPEEGLSQNQIQQLNQQEIVPESKVEIRPGYLPAQNQPSQQNTGSDDSFRLGPHNRQERKGDS